jgi:hypothetical protein
VDLTTIRSFVSLGFSHITAPGALDHILFLLVLAAIYRWTEWRQALVVVTAFIAVAEHGRVPDSIDDRRHRHREHRDSWPS